MANNSKEEMPLEHKFVETELFLTPAGLLPLTFYEISQGGRKTAPRVDFDVRLLVVLRDS